MRCLGMTFHVLSPLQDSVGMITGLVAPFCGDASRFHRSGHQSR